MPITARDFVFCTALLLLSAVSVAMTVELELMPKDHLQRKPINDTTMVACSPVKGTPQIPSSDIRWLDPKGNPLPVDQSLRKHSEFVKGTLMLLIQATTREDEGVYTCVADSESGRLTTSFELTTYMDLTWADAPVVQHPRANSSGYIRCSVVSEPPAEVDWLLNGKNLEFAEGDRCQSVKEGIHCQPILKEDNGIYTCRARVLAIGKMMMREIRVEVHTPPRILVLSGSFEAIEDESVVLTCTAIGDPRPFFSFEDKNNANLKDRPGYRVDEERGTLHIERASKEDSGGIRCIANNSAGEDSAQAILTVVVKPTITKFTNSTVGSGRKATMSCQVYAEPDARVEFTKLATGEKYFLRDEKEDVQEDHVHVSVEEQKTDLGSTFDKVYTIEFLPVERADDGLYQCSATNKGGSASATAHLQVEYAPEFTATQSTQWSWVENPVNLSCSVSAIPHANITWTFEGTDIDAYQNMKVYDSENNSTLYIYPSDNSYFGSYVCKASNKIGERQMTIVLSLARPPGALKQVVLKSTATTMNFDFYGPEPTDGFPVTHYVVEYRKSDEDYMNRRIWDIGTPYVLENLEPMKTYHFRLAAVNQVGDGPWTEEGPLTMPDRGVPLEPPITSLREEDKAVLVPLPNKYELTWDVPADNGESITSFTISYCEERNSSGKIERVTDFMIVTVPHPGSRSYTIHDLTPNTLYKIEIRAENVIGNSEPSSIRIWTAKDPSSIYIQKTGQTPITLDPTGETRVTRAGMSFALIFTMAAFFIVFVAIVIDVSCYYANSCGVTFYLCVHVCKKVPPNEKVKEAALEEGNGTKPRDRKNGKESEKKLSTDNNDKSKSAKENHAVAV